MMEAAAIIALLIAAGGLVATAAGLKQERKRTGDQNTDNHRAAVAVDGTRKRAR